MTHKVRHGLGTIFCLHNSIIGDITFNNKEVQVIVYYDHKSCFWGISNIFVYEGEQVKIMIKVDPVIQLNRINLSSERGHADPDWLYRFIGKISHIVYLYIDVLILAYNCCGTITNVLYQILSENMTKSTESLIGAMFELKYKL